MSFLFTLAAFAVTLGILIVIHEYGHYLVARLCGVKVLRFSVGFGKPVLVKRFAGGETEWTLGAFPLGGYVKMLDEREGAVAPEDLARAFNRQSVVRRIAIVMAGPVANLILAVLLYWVLFMHGIQGLRPVLGDIPPATAAASAGFKRGETLDRVGNESVATWQDVRWALLKRVVPGASVEIETRSDRGEILQHRLYLGTLTANDLDEDFLARLGLARYEPELPPRIGKVLPGGAAELAGLKAGDTILAVNQQAVKRWEDLVRWVRQNPGRLLQLRVARDNDQLDINLVPVGTRENGRAVVGKIGASPMVDPALIERLITEVRYPPHAAFVQAMAKTWDTAAFSLQVLGKMVTGEASWRNISGPITIADYAGQSAHMGWVPFVSFLALLSISLGVLNLLPIPLLDGGHLMYYIVEIIKGSPVSERVMEIGQQIGTVILLSLMLFAFYNDINRLISG
jgi:regulator of sigma E protease